MAGAPDRPPIPVQGMRPIQFAEWYVTVPRWSIFPLAYMSKEPLFRSPHPKGHTCRGECGKLGHGVYDATNDLETVRQWWTDNPNANIGLAVPERHIAVDVDARKKGPLTLDGLEKDHGALPDTVTNLTGSGENSQHQLFTVPADTVIRGTFDTKAYPGLDLKKSPGGYLVVPPSIHPETGQPYLWRSGYDPEDTVIAAAPAWLLELLAQRNGHGEANGDGIPFDPHAIIKEGGRNSSVFTYAEFYHRKGVQDEPLRLMVHAHNQQVCQPPLATGEVDSIITSAQRYEVDPQFMVARSNGAMATLRHINSAPPGQSNSHLPTAAANDNQSWKSELFKKPTKVMPPEHYPSEFNITQILRHDPKWRHEEGRQENMLWYDVIRGRCMIDQEQVSDGLLINLAHWFGGQWRMQFNSTALLEKCVLAHCEANKRDLIQIWLNDLPPWDGTPRLDTWLIDIAKAVDDDKGYTRHVSRRLPLSMVARAMVPGCQYREVVILEGPQNIGKSHILQTLASREWYVEMSMNLETKESHMMLQSAWLAELSELDSMNRTEKARLKAFITMETDTYVPKYRNGTVSYPRRSVMVGTTNDIEYLTDITGNSRFLPVWTPGPITLEPLQEIREQLFAEALQAYREAGDTWWYIPEQVADEAAFQQQERRVTSEWYAPLEAWLTIDRFTQPCYEPGFNAKGDPISVPVVFTPGRTSWPEIARWFLGIEKREGWRDNRLTTPILNCLREMKWTRGKRSRIPGEGRSSYWYSPTYEGEQEDAQWEF